MSAREDADSSEGEHSSGDEEEQEAEDLSKKRKKKRNSNNHRRRRNEPLQRSVNGLRSIAGTTVTVRRKILLYSFART